MPKPRASKLETATARLKLPVRKKPFYVKLGRGIFLGYRRNTSGGSWSVRSADGSGGEWLKRIAAADDLEPAAPPAVLNYWQAMEAARKLVQQPGAVEDNSRPLTVAEALDRYQSHLTANEGDTRNVSRVRGHLPASIASKPVALLGAVELKRWRDALAGKVTPASINRTANALKAALSLAAAHDPRIANARAWKIGLASLPNAHRTRNIILDDATIRRIVEAAYGRDDAFGLLIETLATTGARFSQVARLEVGDVQAERARVMLPLSAKGRDRAKRHERRAVPIPHGLVAKLEHAATGRPTDTPLLTSNDGMGWGHRKDHIREAFREVAAALNLDPDRVTPYALRHSNVVRMLKANTPIRIVASLHDTSVAMIERTYSKHISEYTDDIARPALLSIETPSGDTVVERLPK